MSSTRSRRGHHEGSIYQRGDDRWAAAMTVGYEGGKRKTFYGRTRQEVQQQLTTALNSQQVGLPIPSDRETVGAFLDRWLADVAKPSIRAKTYRSYEQLVRLHLRPGLGHIVLSRLTAQDVQTFLNRKLSSGLSARTVHHLHARLRGALNQAVRWGLVARNVAALASPPHVEQVEVQPLDPGQARVLLDALQDERLQALFTVPLAVGIRPGEALGLRWIDVNLDTGTISVCRALQRIEGKLQLVELKTRRSRRQIALPDVASLPYEHIKQGSVKNACG